MHFQYASPSSGNCTQACIYICVDPCLLRSAWALIQIERDTAIYYLWYVYTMYHIIHLFAGPEELSHFTLLINIIYIILINTNFMLDCLLLVRRCRARPSRLHISMYVFCTVRVCLLYIPSSRQLAQYFWEDRVLLRKMHILKMQYPFTNWSNCRYIKW